MIETKAVHYTSENYDAAMKAISQAVEDGFEVKGFAMGQDPSTNKIVCGVLLVKRHRGEMDVTAGAEWPRL